ncbi:MAG: hypothetical protein ACRECV_14695 [Xanthobacteraceae bacterium]
MYRIPALSLALLLASGAVSLAQFPSQPAAPALPGSEHERAACRPDVVRFCRAELARNQDDVFSILGCLERNRSRISRACQNVLSANGR